MEDVYSEKFPEPSPFSPMRMLQCRISWILEDFLIISCYLFHPKLWMRWGKSKILLQLKSLFHQKLTNRVILGYLFTLLASSISFASMIFIHTSLFCGCGNRSASLDFCWLVLSDRLNTRNMLTRGHYHSNSGFQCLMCEIIEHMLFHCPFSKECWLALGMPWEEDGTRLNIIEKGKHEWRKPMFMEIFMLSPWNIWKERNKLLFEECVLRLHPGRQG
jgi:hypothetical protein